MKQKGFAQILILLVVVLVAGYFAFQYYRLKNQTIASLPPVNLPVVSPTALADPTADWQTYTNKIYNYEFKYPDNWYIIPNKDNSVDAGPNSLESLQALGGHGGGVDNPIFIVYSNQNAITDSADGTEKVLSQKNIDVSGIPAISYKVSGSVGFEEATIVLIKSKKLEIIYYDKPFQQYQDTFDQILSTFKFTDTSGDDYTPETTAITQSQLDKGWYWGDSQKRPGTPSNWVFKQADESSCWHKPDIVCGGI